MIRRSSIFLLLLFAASLAFFSYFISLRLTIDGYEQDSFAPPELREQEYPPHESGNDYHQHNISSNQSHTPTKSNEATKVVNITELFNLTIPIHNYKKDDPFAPQKRTGAIWKSPYKHQNNGQSWWKYSDTCFAVDDICRASQNRWFYFHQGSHRDTTNADEKWQPNFELKYMPYAYSVKTWADTRVQMDVQSSSFVLWEKLLGTNQCSLSSVPYHVVLQSNYNDVSNMIRVVSRLLLSFTRQLTYFDF